MESRASKRVVPEALPSLRSIFHPLYLVERGRAQRRLAMWNGVPRCVAALRRGGASRRCVVAVRRRVELARAPQRELAGAAAAKGERDGGGRSRVRDEEAGWRRRPKELKPAVTQRDSDQM